VSSEPDPLPPGFEVGHWTASDAPTGCTVILPPPGSRAGVDVRGGGPGTRETDVIDPLANPEEATAVLFTGGSAYGLAAADGVVRWCEERGRGYATPAGPVPLVPAAVIYDLTATATAAGVRPGAEQGYAACEAAAGGVPERGCVGAARGAAVAKARGRERSSPGGVGYAAVRTGADETVAAIAVVNATGDVLAEDGSILAGPRADDGETQSSAALLAGALGPPAWVEAGGERQSTTLACITTDAGLDKLGCAKVARMASAGIARAIDPAFTPFDGDVVFCLAAGQADPSPWQIARVGSVAATVVAAAIRDGVREAAASS
jgi:L-aminopeptidase/D-esterase-like protein